MELFVGILMIIIIGGTIYQILEQRRVRKNKDGTLNKSDLAHNAKSYNKYMLKDNPWMLDKSIV